MSTQPSYKREDEDFARNLRDKLLQWGYSVWMDIFDIPKGAYWPDEIEDGLRNSDVVVGLLSPRSVTSRNVKNEWDWAIVNGDHFGTKLILNMVEQCIVPMNYISINYVDFSSTASDLAFSLLKKALNTDQQSSSNADPYREYLKSLYDRVNTFLEQKLISDLQDTEGRPEPIHIKVTSNLDAVMASPAPNITLDPLFSIAGIEEKPTYVRDEFETFNEAFDYYGKRVLLLGEPGAGKTITLLHYCRDAIVHRLQDISQPLPILGIAPTWDADANISIEDWLASAYGSPQNTKDLMQSGNALLLLDGLDELGSKRLVNKDDPEQGIYDPRQRFISIIPPNIPILLTCRAEEYQEIGTKVNLNSAVTLCPLEKNQLAKYLDKQPKLLTLIESDEQLNLTLSNPLLLSLFASVFEDFAEDLSQFEASAITSGDIRDLIFTTYISSRYLHEARKPFAAISFEIDDIYEYLGRLAAVLTNPFTQEFNFTRTFITQQLDLPDIQIETLLNLCQQLRIIVQNPDKSYRFLHLMIKDHFANKYALDHLFDWQAYATSSNFKLAIQMNPADILGEVGGVSSVPHLQKLLFAEEINTEDRLSALRAMGSVGNEDTAGLIVDHIENFAPSIAVEYEAIIALGKIASPQTVDFVSNYVSSLYEYIRQEAVITLGKIASIDGVPALLDALNDTTARVRSYAAEALGVIGDGRAVLPLVTATKEREVIIRQVYINALKNIHMDNAIIPLIQAFSHENDAVRDAVSIALQNIGLNAVDELIKATQSESAQIRYMACITLGKIRDPRALDALQQLITDNTNVSFIRNVSDYAKEAIEMIEKSLS